MISLRLKELLGEEKICLILSSEKKAFILFMTGSIQLTWPLSVRLSNL
jgi:hypothetical protein